MSQAILNAINRATEKRRRKLAAWWANKMRDPRSAAEIMARRAAFEAKHESGETIPAPEPIEWPE